MRKVITEALKKYKWQIVVLILLIGINIYLLTIPSKIVGDIVDLLYDISSNKQVILNNTYYLIGICIVLLLIRMIWKYINGVINRGAEKYIKEKVFERFLKLKVKEIQKIKNGEIMSYFIKDVSEIRVIIYRILSYGTRFVFTFLIVSYQMAKEVDIKLTLISLCPIVLAIFLVIKIKKYTEISFKKAQAKFTDLSEYIQESTDGIRTTKAYSCEGDQLKEFIRKNRQVRQSDNTVDVFSNLSTTCMDICFGLCYAILILYGSHLVLTNEISIGELVAFNGYIGLFVGPVSWIPGIVSRYKRAQISYHRLDRLFELEREKTARKDTKQKEVLEGNIEIKDLNFNYPGMLDKALENINMTIKKGETIGIIGTTGSGKTTLMNLLAKLYSVPRDKIFIDGRDINDINADTLRDNICYITQDSFIFSSTLKDNISLFKDEYKEKDIKDSTKKAVVYDDISKMPKGIKTVVGVRGTDLSGGQKQRVVVSRAFLRNSRILIFDDTFSALDSRTSRQVLKNIKELSEEKTCIIISNKISDIKHSDQIFVLDGGNIIEHGKHTGLLEKHGIYYQFYRQQAKRTKTTKTN